MRINTQRILSLAVLAVLAALLAACGGTGGTASNGSTVDPNETAAKVNGTAITMQEVDRAVKQQAQGQESKLSPLELAGARLQVLQSLIEQEVMYQKAQKENLVPTDDEVTVELNKRKVDSHLSAEEFDKKMAEAGFDEKSLRESIKRGLAIQKLIDNVTGKISPPKDSEIEAFYNGNKDAFVKKRGVKLAAIVIDPSNSGPGDTTTDEQSAVLKGNEVIKKLQTGQDFAQLAAEYSEDQSKLQNGDLGYVSEDDMKQSFPAPLVATLMSPDTPIGKLLTSQIGGKFYILKLQERSDRDEALTLDSPGVRQQVTDSLVNDRKQLLATSYQAIAMNQAKIENFLAQKVVDNPNELSGARPAGTVSPSNTASNANTAPVNTDSNSNAASAPNGNTGAANKPTPAAKASPAAATPKAATSPAAAAPKTTPKAATPAANK